MKLNIGIIKGDGIGPEVVLTEAVKVLDRIAEVYGHECEYTQLLMGGASIDVHGIPLTDETIRQAKKCDAILMGIPSAGIPELLRGISWNLQNVRRRGF